MTFRSGRISAIAFAAVFASSLSVLAQTPPPKPPDQKPPATPAGQTPQTPARKPGDPKPYKEVVTEAAKTQKGVVKVHRIDEKVLWELPESLLNREFLWQVEIAGTSKGSGMFGPYNGAGAGVRVVRFTRRNNTIYMRDVDYSMRTEATDGLLEALKLNTLEPILQSFSVDAEGEWDDKSKTVVIDVTRMFMSDPQELSVKGMYRAGGVDPSKSYIDKISAFPDNIETRSQLTFVGAQGPSMALVHYSTILLPEKPMIGRYRDTRVGYFATPSRSMGEKRGGLSRSSMSAASDWRKKIPARLSVCRRSRSCSMWPVRFRRSGEST